MTNDLDRTSVSLDDLDEPPAPLVTNDESATLIEEAMTSLVLLRFPASLGDATAELHALASLVAEAESHIGVAMAAALDQDYGFDDIAICLGVTADEAQRRFADEGRTIAEVPFDD